MTFSSIKKARIAPSSMNFSGLQDDNLLIIKRTDNKVQETMRHNAKLTIAVEPADKQKNILRRGQFSAFPEVSSTVR